MKSKACYVLAALLLSGCGRDGIVTPPNTEPPTTQPGQPGSQYLPAAGFWNGKRTPGPWCAGQATQQSVRPQGVGVTSPLSIVTPQMQGLRGLSADLTALSGQSAQNSELAVLLPTHKDAVTALNDLRASGVEVTGTFGYWTTIRADAAIAAHLVSEGRVQYAEKLPTFKAVGMPTPTDANLRNQSTYLPMMNTQAAWSQLDLGCDHPVVAVVDSGWSGSTTHAEANLVPRSAWFNAITGVQGNADPSGSGDAAQHGTAVAGVIAMTTNGYGNGAGVSYNLAKVLPIAVMSPSGSINGSAAARGIEYAMGSTVVNGQNFTNPYPASVINLSFGSAATLTPSQFFQTVFDAAAARGVVIVAAVGNELAHGTTDTAGLNHSIGVAGVMLDGNRWVDPYTPGFGSNYGPAVDVAAPAMSVPVVINGSETYWSGTSMATPWVSAQIAMWMYSNQHYRADGSKTLGLTGDALYDKLYACFAAIGSRGGNKDEYLGYGKLDTGRLVNPNETACH